MVKKSTDNAGDTRDSSSVPGSERSPGEGNGNPLHYSCLENSMDRGAWQATVLGVTESGTRLSMNVGILCYVLSVPTLLSVLFMTGR